MMQGPEVLSQPPHPHFSSFAGPGESMAIHYRHFSSASVPSNYPQPVPPFPADASEVDDVIEGEIVNDDYDDESSFISHDFVQPFAKPFAQPFAQPFPHSSDPLSRVDEYDDDSFPAAGAAAGSMARDGYGSPASSVNSAIECNGGSVIVYDGEPQTPVLEGEPVYDYCGEDDEDGSNDGDDYYDVDEEEEEDDDDENCVTLELAAPDVAVAARNTSYTLPNAQRSSSGPVQVTTDLYASPLDADHGDAFLTSASAPKTPRQLQGNHGRSGSVSYNGHQRQLSVSSNGHQRQLSVSSNGHQRQLSVSSNGHQRQLSVSSNGHQRQLSVSCNGHQRKLSGSALSMGSGGKSRGADGSSLANGSRPASGASSGSGTDSNGRRTMRKSGTLPEERSRGRGSIAASAAAIAATAAAGAPWAGAGCGGAGRGSASFPQYSGSSTRVLMKAASMPPAVDSRRPFTGGGGGAGGGGGSARTPRPPAVRPQQRQQVSPPNHAPGHVAAHPSPRARLLSAKSPRVPAKSPHTSSTVPPSVALKSSPSPRTFRGGAGTPPTPSQQQLRALAQSRSLPPQSPASAAAAAVASVKAAAFPKSPSSFEPSSGSGTAQGQARNRPRQPSAASAHPNRSGTPLSPALRPVSHALPVRKRPSSLSIQSQSPQQQLVRVEPPPQMRKPKLPPLDIAGIQDDSQQEDMSPSVYALQQQPLQVLQPPQHSRRPSQGQQGHSRAQESGLDAKQPLKGILKSSKVQPEQGGGEQVGGDLISAQEQRTNGEGVVRKRFKGLEETWRERGRKQKAQGGRREQRGEARSSVCNLMRAA
ncbi:hypothetical protein CLOM_g18135 [Closterium sp. NIES-68]|nr:hypothetical protein CLOM_g18135 [Closterium sp. NIES-68]